MTRKCLTVCVLTVVCGVLAGCGGGSDPETAHLREQLSKADAAVQRLRGENFIFEERAHRMDDAVNEVSRQLHQLRGQYDEVVRLKVEFEGRLGFAEEQARSTFDALEQQTRDLKDGDVDAALRKTHLKLVNDLKALQAELLKTRNEVDRLRQLCAKNNIDVSPDAEKPGETPPAPGGRP